MAVWSRSRDGDHPHHHDELLDVENIDDYITYRLLPNLKWYERKGNRSKKIYQRMQTLAVAGAAIVPVLVSYSNKWFPGAIVAVTVGVVVALIAALEGVWHFREQWKNYRSTEQYLARELMLYKRGAGPYVTFSQQMLRDRLLVENVEQAIAAEGAATLSIMTVPATAQSTTSVNGSQAGTDVPRNPPSP